jgi:hypothetical protein
MPALEKIITQPPAATMDEVVQMLAAMDESLPDGDGVKWFNRLYLSVTKAVKDSVVDQTFNDNAWLARLDVVFANLYFDALRLGAVQTSGAPSAWRPLLVARNKKGIARIQFALAGMNAHINRDLPVAIVKMFQAGGGAPDRQGPHFADYERVNGILEAVEAQVKQEFTTGIVGVVDVAAGSLDDVMAMWSIRAARDAAWTQAELLWQVRNLPILQRNFLSTLDNFTGFAGRGLLRRVGIV